MEINPLETMKDCFDRKSFQTQDEATGFSKWMVATHNIIGLVAFRCNRCARWHLAAGHKEAIRHRQTMKLERCVSDRDLHLQLARNAGCSLDELQTRMDLSKIKILGAAFQFVSIKQKENQ